MNCNKMKKFQMKTYTATAAAIIFSALFAITGCGKKPVMRTDYIVPVSIKETVESTAEPFSSIKAYAYYCDTTAYRPLSYQQAFDGELGSVSANGTVKYDVIGEYDNDKGRIIFTNLDRSPVTLVICDVVNELYAYSEKKLEAGLPEITVPLLFEPYKFTKNGTVIESNGWRIKSSPRPEPEPEEEE